MSCVHGLQCDCMRFLTYLQSFEGCLMRVFELCQLLLQVSQLCHLVLPFSFGSCQLRSYHNRIMSDVLLDSSSCQMCCSTLHNLPVPAHHVLYMQCREFSTCCSRSATFSSASALMLLILCRGKAGSHSAHCMALMCAAC